jgi:hypothetical protein
MALSSQQTKKQTKRKIFFVGGDQDNLKNNCWGDPRENEKAKPQKTLTQLLCGWI